MKELLHSQAHFFLNKPVVKSTIRTLIILILLVSFIHWFQTCSTQRPQPDQIFPTKTDTIFIDRPYEVEKPLPLPVKPVTLVQWKTEQVTIDSVVLKHDTVYITTENNSFSYHERFLALFPENPKLLGIELRKKDFNISTLKPSGEITTENFKVDLERYNYRYTENSLSAKPVKYRSNDFGIGMRSTVSWKTNNQYETEVLAGFRIKNIYLMGGATITIDPSTRMGFHPQVSITHHLGF